MEEAGQDHAANVPPLYAFPLNTLHNFQPNLTTHRVYTARKKSEPLLNIYSILADSESL